MVLVTIALFIADEKVPVEAAQKAACELKLQESLGPELLILAPSRCRLRYLRDIFGRQFLDHSKSNRTTDGFVAFPQRKYEPGVSGHLPTYSMRSPSGIAVTVWFSFHLSRV